MPRALRAVTMLRLLLVIALFGPAATYVTAASLSYGRMWEATREDLREERAVLAEHVTRLFDAHLLIADRVSAMVDGRSAVGEDGLPGDALDLHRRLKAMIQGVPQVYSIWVADGAGDLVATSQAFPVPPGVSFRDRDYFQAAMRGDAHYISAVGKGRVDGVMFFSVAVPVRGADGRPQGVVAVSSEPRHFSRVLNRMGVDAPDMASLVRTDGTFLTRYPFTFDEPPFPRLMEDSPFQQQIAEQPRAGTYRVAGTMDGVERFFSYQKLDPLPVYLILGREVDTVVGAWSRDMLRYLPLVLVLTVGLSAVTLIALRQAARQDEVLDRLRAEKARSAAATEALRRSQKMEAMGQLTGGVAHDFNNLLQVVASSLALLKRQGRPEIHAQALLALDQAVARGRDLTGHLLSFARRQAVAPQPLYLSAGMERIEALLAHALPSNILRETRIPDDIWSVYVDPGELELALLNISLNARDAMPQGGRLTLEAQNVVRPEADEIGPAGDFVAIAIRDTGVGIAAEDLPNVFDPFYTTKPVGSGTGLGLSQVYGFAQQAEGFAAVESVEGEGTTVTLFLPRNRRPVSGQARPEAKTETTGGVTAEQRPLQVLYVEDDPSVMASVMALLQENGHGVATVGDAAAALAMIDDGAEVDCVLSDIMMAGEMDGLALARRLRTLRPLLPVILITGYSTSARAAIDEGFAVLRKPVDARGLESVLQKAVAG